METSDSAEETEEDGTESEVASGDEAEATDVAERSEGRGLTIVGFVFAGLLFFAAVVPVGVSYTCNNQER